MLVKTKDDQQYGIIKGTVKQGKSVAYTVQCYGHLPRVGPWIRKCTLMRTYTQPASLLQMNSVVLIGYNYQDKKTGAIAYVYAGASELSQLIQHAEDYEVPDKLVQTIEQQHLAQQQHAEDCEVPDKLVQTIEQQQLGEDGAT